jgi:integrase/recombinase XerC/integrase/recombinase XerD
MYRFGTLPPPAAAGAAPPPAEGASSPPAPSTRLYPPRLPRSGTALPENDALLDRLLLRFEEFVDYALAQNQSKMTVRWYRDGFRNYVKFLREGLHLPPEEFQNRVYDISGWTDWNLRERKLSAISTNGYWRCVKLFWNDVAARDGVQHPFEGKKAPAVPTHVPKAHAPEDCRRILLAAEHYPWETPFHRVRAVAIIGIALLAGLRRSEILGLMKEDVKLEEGTIFIRHGKGRGGGKQRTAYITDELRMMLRRYEAERLAAKLYCPEYFASLKYRRGIKLDTLKRLIRYVRAASGVKVTLHSLRHSYVSWLVRSGVPLPVASELAGHTAIETTLKYVKVFDADKRAAVKQLRLG